MSEEIPLNLSYSSVQIDINQYQTYLRNQINLPVSPIQEWIILRTPPTSRDQEREFNLSGLNSVIQPIAIHVWSEDNNRDAITFFVLANNEVIFKNVISNNNMPYTFPAFLLLPQLTIKVKPNYNIQSCLIYCKQAFILKEVVAV